MGKNKRKNFTPSALHELDEELRIVQTLNYRDVVWKTGDLVSVIEDDQEYHAQVAQPCHNEHVLNNLAPRSRTPTSPTTRRYHQVADSKCRHRSLGARA